VREGRRLLLPGCLSLHLDAAPRGLQAGQLVHHGAHLSCSIETLIEETSSLPVGNLISLKELANKIFFDGSLKKSL
jgi:hypothetical protein